ncbi:hypothetical protein K7432_012069 [Basidiobolus ranarum]|uniref:Uncharacterized protein n=1 Tax=Basidiobolus ranarum TaxID=34480 RepID=A0ABR2WLF5_9FUNG
MTKSNYHQNVRFSSFDEEKSLPPPPLPLSRTRPRDIRPIVPKTIANTRNTTQFASPPTLKHSQNTDNKSSKSEPRLRRVVDSIKSPASLKTATQSRRSSTSPPQARDGYQPVRESLRYDSKNTHSTRLQNHLSTTKNSSTPPSSAVGPRTCTVETKPNSSNPHPFLRKNSATISNKSRTPSQPFSPSPKPDVVKRRYPDVINNKSTGSVNNTPRKNSGPKPTLASTPQHLKVITRSGVNHPIDLKVKTGLEGTSERSNKNIVNNEGVTKSRLSGLLSPTRPGLIPYPFREKKKAHIVGNMQFDPVKMCWNSVGNDGNSEEVNGEDDPFANFSSDEEDSVFSLNAQGTSEDPVEEFIVGTEFQLSPHELRGMFKAEIEHKSTMQKWYTKADRCTNHDRIGLKNPRGVELFDIRPTWRDRFGPR